jgi:hypothetical protein
MSGSIQQRAGKRRTTCTVVFDLPRDPITGKRRQQRVSAPTRRQVEPRLASALNDLPTGVHGGATAATVGQFLAYWLDRYGRPNSRPTTYRSYEQVIRVHIDPALGPVPLRVLQPTRLQHFYAQKLAKRRGDGAAGGLSPNTVRCLHTILREALDPAVK